MTAHFEVLRVELRPPSSGWGVFRVEKGDLDLEVAFSHVPDDTVTQLAEAVDAVVSGPAERRIVFHEEPSETELLLRHHGDPARVTMTLLHYPDHRRDREGRLLLEVPLSPLLAGKLFWRALRQVEGSTTPETYEHDWGHPFPTRTVAQLGQRLAGRIGG